MSNTADTPVETAIRSAIPGDTGQDRQHRVTLMRIAHAAENAEDALGLLGYWLSDYLRNPAAFAAPELLTHFTDLTARNLNIAARELAKSLPELLARTPRLIQIAREKETPNVLPGTVSGSPTTGEDECPF